MVNLEQHPFENLDYLHPTHFVPLSLTINVVKFLNQVLVALQVHDYYVFDSERHGILQESHVDRTVCHNTPKNNVI